MPDIVAIQLDVMYPDRMLSVVYMQKLRRIIDHAEFLQLSEKIIGVLNVVINSFLIIVLRQ